MAHKKTYQELEMELGMLKKHGIGSNLTKIIITTIQFGTFVLIAYFATDAIKSMAGLETKATIDIKFWDNALSAIFGGGGIYYGYKQKKLRKETVEPLQKKVIHYENTIDKRRSSSGLTPLGDTDPEDL